MANKRCLVISGLVNQRFEILFTKIYQHIPIKIVIPSAYYTIRSQHRRVFHIQPLDKETGAVVTKGNAITAELLMLH